VKLNKSVRVKAPRDAAVEIIERDATLCGLFPEAETAVVSRDTDRKILYSKFEVMGRPAEATFHFTFLMDGNVRFEKVCDGNVWKSLRGELNFEEDGDDTEVEVNFDGRTRGLVPEFTIKGPMQEQLSSMVDALKETIEGAARG